VRKKITPLPDGFSGGLFAQTKSKKKYKKE
jgi:hypothetical protein